jgi:hypothetical protein
VTNSVDEGNETPCSIICITCQEEFRSMNSVYICSIIPNVYIRCLNYRFIC